jgi:hypothetical protein
MANNYTLGRGKVFFDPFATGATVTASLKGLGERYLGNTPEFSLALESSKLDHFNADEGVRTKDRSVLLELNRTGSFTCDNIDADNLSLFVLGSKSTVSQSALTAQTTLYEVVLADNAYQIGASATNPAGVRKVASVVITDTDTPATTYVLNTDYTLDTDLARVTVIAGSSMVGKDITITYNTTVTTYEKIVTAADAEVEGSLRFIAYNAEGTQRDFYFPYVRLTPSGDFALKGDDWQTLSFDVEVLKKADTVEAIYINGRPA